MLVKFRNDMKIFSRILIFAVLMSLVGCAGTGLKDSGTVIQRMNVSSDSRSVFVLRDTGFAGGASSVDVRLNGNSIGTIGVGEVAVGTAIPGQNLLWADFTLYGLKGPAESTFKSNSSSNHYFVMTQTADLLTTKRRLIKVDEEQFKSYLK